MKKILTILLIFLSVLTYGQSEKNFTVRNKLKVNNEFELNTKTVNSITDGDTLATKKYIDDNAFIQPLDSITFNDDVPEQFFPYKIYADSLTKSIGYFLPNDLRRNFLGGNLYVPVINGTSDTLKIRRAVSIIGGETEVSVDAVRNLPVVSYTQIDTVTSARLILGVTAEDIPPNEVGRVARFDFIRTNTSDFEKDDNLYVDTLGYLTTEEPLAPSYSLFVGTVFHRSSSG